MDPSDQNTDNIQIISSFFSETASILNQSSAEGSIEPTVIEMVSCLIHMVTIRFFLSLWYVHVVYLPLNDLLVYMLVIPLNRSPNLECYCACVVNTCVHICLFICMCVCVFICVYVHACVCAQLTLLQLLVSWKLTLCCFFLLWNTFQKKYFTRVTPTANCGPNGVLINLLRGCWSTLWLKPDLFGSHEMLLSVYSFIDLIVQ